MVEIRTWYTYATDVLGYMNPSYKLTLGITRESTCEKLKEVDRFLICPKDTIRHRREIFKSIYEPLYDQKNNIILPEDHFLIQACGEIVDSFIISLNDDLDINFIKALGPFVSWTVDHIVDYTLGKNVMQEGVSAGSIAIFILRVYKLQEYVLHHRPAIQSVSNQYFNIEIEDDDFVKRAIPILPDEEFNEILSSVKYVYSLYSANKS